MRALDRQLEQCLASEDKQPLSLLEWLKQKVRTLISLWEGAQLNQAPLVQLQRLVRATLWIPRPLVDAEVLLCQLEGQNQWVCVKKWLLFHHEAKTIREREGRINYMLSSFNLKLKEKEASIEEGQTPMEEIETPRDEASTSGIGPQINFILINHQHCPMATTVLCRRLDKM